MSLILETFRRKPFSRSPDLAFHTNGSATRWLHPPRTPSTAPSAYSSATASRVMPMPTPFTTSTSNRSTARKKTIPCFSVPAPVNTAFGNSSAGPKTTPTSPSKTPKANASPASRSSRTIADVTLLAKFDRPIPNHRPVILGTRSLRRAKPPAAVLRPAYFFFFVGRRAAVFFCELLAELFRARLVVRFPLIFLFARLPRFFFVSRLVICFGKRFPSSAASPTNVPTAPPIKAPTGPATVAPRIAPVAIPAVFLRTCSLGSTRVLLV